MVTQDAAHPPAAWADPVLPGDVLREVLGAAATRGGAALALVAGPDDREVVSWLNRAAADLLTLEPAEALAEELEHVGPPMAAGVEHDWRAVVQDLVRCGGGATSARVPRVDQRVTDVWLEVAPVPGCEAGGTRTWLLQLQRTSQELTAAREVAAEAEHRFAALAEHAPVGIFVSEAGVRLGYVNDAFGALAGRPADGLLGTGWLDLVHPGDLPDLFEAMEGVLGGELSERTVRLQPAGTTQRWVQVRLAPVTTPRRAAGFIGTIEDITARRAWEEQLAYQASHDPLTGLANRRRLLDTLSHLLVSRRRVDRRFAVLFCDLDGFKQINDTLGHDAGDRVLVEVARRLASTAREEDLVARIAGDEFVVVLRALDGDGDAEVAAQRQLAALVAPVYVSGRGVEVSASLGVAFPRPGDSPDTILRSADRLMYQAKSSGPGRYRIADEAGRDVSEHLPTPRSGDHEGDHS